MAVSRDQGKTWANRQTVGTKFGIQNAVFPTVVAGDDDRASIAYLGTPTGGNSEDNANFHGVWHLYVDTTYDGGKTWVTSDATPERPGAGRLDLHRRHHLWRRPQPARLHRRDDRRPRPRHGGVRRRLHQDLRSDPQHVGRDAYATIARQKGGRVAVAKYDSTVDDGTRSPGSGLPRRRMAGSWPSPR